MSKITFKRHDFIFPGSSFTIKVDGEEIGSLNSKAVGNIRLYRWWAGCAAKGIPLKNTWEEKLPLIYVEEAKGQAREYIKQCLANKKEGEI